MFKLFVLVLAMFAVAVMAAPEPKPGFIAGYRLEYPWTYNYWGYAPYHYGPYHAKVLCHGTSKPISITELKFVKPAWIKWILVNPQTLSAEVEAELKNCIKAKIRTGCLCSKHDVKEIVAQYFILVLAIFAISAMAAPEPKPDPGLIATLRVNYPWAYNYWGYAPYHAGFLPRVL
ncbi:hypothetical protein ILUMI_25583, partial [Ignelater luminosus]